MFYAAGGFKEYITARVSQRLNADSANTQVDFDADETGIYITVTQYHMVAFDTYSSKVIPFSSLADFEEWMNDEV
jgi:hypothetical protein